MEQPSAGRLGILTLSRNAKHVHLLNTALAMQHEMPSHVKVLVNNAAGQEAEAICGEGLESKWYTVAFGRNTSFAEGNNQAAELARQVAPGLTHYLLLNDDARPHRHAISELWLNRDQADIVGSLILNTDGTVNHAGHDPRLPDPHMGRGSDAAQWSGFYFTPAVTFAAALISRAAWVRLGGLHEGYVYGYEDTDFCLRAREKGLQCGVAASAVFTHDECGTRVRGMGPQDVRNRDLFKERCGHIEPLLEDL